MSTADRAQLLQHLEWLQTHPTTRLVLRRGATEDHDPAEAHRLADEALLAYIGDDEITKAFDAIPKWYS